MPPWQCVAFSTKTTAFRCCCATCDTPAGLHETAAAVWWAAAAPLQHVCVFVCPATNGAPSTPKIHLAMARRQPPLYCSSPGELPPLSAKQPLTKVVRNSSSACGASSWLRCPHSGRIAGGGAPRSAACASTPHGDGLISRSGQLLRACGNHLVHEPFRRPQHWVVQPEVGSAASCVGSGRSSHQLRSTCCGGHAVVCARGDGCGQAGGGAAQTRQLPLRHLPRQPADLRQQNHSPG